jgi:hypothetical protein
MYSENIWFTPRNERPHFLDPLRIHSSPCFLQIFFLCESLPFNQKNWSAPFSFANFASKTFWASVTILFYNTCNAFYFLGLILNRQDTSAVAMRLNIVDFSDISVWNFHKLWPYYPHSSVRQRGTNLSQILIFLPSSRRISFRLPVTMQLIIHEL